MIKVKNRSNGVESEFTNDRWNEIKNDPKWSKTFQVMDAPVKKPAEAQKLADAKTAGNAAKNDPKNTTGTTVSKPDNKV